MIRNPGKNTENQLLVERDLLITEFGTLSNDPERLLGVLEDTLQKHGDEHCEFEAKKLLCALFQVQIQCLAVIHKFAYFFTFFYHVGILQCLQKSSHPSHIHAA